MVSAAVAGIFLGSLTAFVIVIVWLGWGKTSEGQPIHVDPTRSDYVDLLLTIVTVLLGAIGLGVTVGALVIGLVALKTLREIKDEAAIEAKGAAAEKITSVMAEELEPSIDAKVKESLPNLLLAALLDNKIGHDLMTRLAKTGSLDDVVERVMVKMNQGGPELDTEGSDNADDRG